MSFLKTFGKNPSGRELDKVKESPQYRNGIFNNLSETTLMLQKTSFLKMMWRFMNKAAYTKPPKKLPSVISDLKYSGYKHPFIVWFGHSSYLIHIADMNILVDPVLSGHASPFSFTAMSFKGSDIYTTGDLPEIDMLILTHDHYDHLDYKTILSLKSKTKKIYTSLGVASHLLYWGIDKKIISEFDWWQSEKINANLELIALPARHFSGRTFARNKTLWSSFILETSTHSIYIGADSGYDTHFSKIGERFGPIDIAILESGQYNEAWPEIHMMPEQTVQAAIDLRAKVLLPVHWGKFALAFHPWDEPVKRVKAKARELGVTITTPMIGEPVIIDSTYPQKDWWEF